MDSKLAVFHRCRSYHHFAPVNYAANRFTAFGLPYIIFCIVGENMTSCSPFETVFITFIIEKDFVRKKSVELRVSTAWLGHLKVE